MFFFNFSSKHAVIIKAIGLLQQKYSTYTESADSSEVYDMENTADCALRCCKEQHVSSGRSTSLQE